MERENKRILNRRLRYLYIGYFLILAVGFMHGVLPLFARSVAEGIRQGEKMLEQIESEGSCSEWYLVAVKPRLFDASPLSLPHLSQGATLSFEPVEGLLSVEIDPETMAPERLDRFRGLHLKVLFFEMLSMACWLAILVLIALMINSMRRSVRDQHPLPKSNILNMRLIGVFIILNQLFEGLVYSLGHRMVELLYSAEQGSYGEFFPIDYGMVLLGLLVLFGAEVFAIGSRLSEEQRLTI